MTAGIFATVDEAQRVLCPEYESYEPQPQARQVYEELYGIFRNLYFAFGNKTPASFDLTGTLRRLRRTALSLQETEQKLGD